MQPNNTDPVIKFLKQLLNFLHNYSNLILALLTFALVYVTSQYVNLAKHSLETLEKQVEIIQSDYAIRSLPEIHIFPPKDKSHKDKKGLEFTITNTGFQAINVRVKVVPCYNQIPTRQRIGPLYRVGNTPFYVEESLFRLGENVSFNLFIPEEDYTISKDLGFIVFLRYDVPFKEEPEIEYKYFHWKPQLESWQGLSKEHASTIIYRATKEGLLKDF